MNHHQFLKDNILTRREALASMGSGLGTAALATLLGANNAHGVETKKGTGGLADLPHFAAKAKRVVVLWQGGGPSHVDLFDEKPMMKTMLGKTSPIRSGAAPDFPPCRAAMVSGPAFPQ